MTVKIPARLDETLEFCRRKIREEAIDSGGRVHGADYRRAIEFAP
jgi:hypothetical protein